jgi:hypothetical protein
MSWESVPWFVGGGAEHSPEAARHLSYVTLNGNEGIVASGDLKVTQTATASDSVNIAAGSAAILNRATTNSQQTYTVRKTAVETLAIAPTGATPRSDLIIARVEDPFGGESWQIPATVATGPYVFTRVISGVNASTTTLPANSGSAIVLARIDVPANTSVITSGMITDLRAMANPRRRRELVHFVPSSNLDLTNNSSYVDWVSMTSALSVPTWATQAQIRTTLHHAQLVSGSWSGNIRHQLVSGVNVLSSGNARVDLAFVAANATRFDVNTVSTFALSAAWRAGVTATVRLQGAFLTRTNLAVVRADSSAWFMADVEFRESPI